MTDSQSRPGVWGRVPQRNLHFTGRDKLLEQMNRIWHEKSPARPLALVGMGGIGKTQIAVESTYRHLADYDVVWWIPSDIPELVRSSLSRLAGDLGIQPDRTDTLEAVLSSLRTGQPYSRWLLIFDNAEDISSISEYIPDGPGNVLITSRNRDWDGIVTTIAVDVFTSAESREYLLRRNPGLTSEKADQIAEALGHLPLALTQVASLQTQTGMTTEEYLELLETHTTQLLEEGVPSNYSNSLASTIGISIANLRNYSPVAFKLLKLLSFFGPEAVPRSVIGFRPSPLSPPLLSDLGAPLSLNRAIGVLRRFSLVEIDFERRTIQLHNLLRMLLQQEVAEEERDYLLRAVRDLLAASARPASPDDPRQWPLLSSLVPHLDSAGVFGSLEHESRHLLLQVIRFLYRSGDAGTAERFALEVLPSWSDSDTVPPEDLCVLRRHLGHALRSQGRFREAYELDSETAAFAGERFGEHIETFRLTNSLSSGLRSLGRFSDAYVLNSDAVPLYREVLGRRHPVTLVAELDLGLDLMVMGRIQEAVDLLSAVHSVRHELQGADHPATLIAMNNLIRAIRLKGDFSDARELGEDLYGVALSTLGPDHMRTMRAANDLAIAMRLSEGGSAESVDFAEARLRQYRGTAWERHPDNATAKVLLSNAYRETDRLNEAFALAEEAHRELSRLYGGEHPYALGAQGNLAVLHRMLGRPGEAEELSSQAARALEESLGLRSLITLQVVLNLGSDKAELGDLDAARLLGERALPVAAELLGEDHPLTLGWMFNLGLDLRPLDPGRGDSLRREAASALRARLGGIHPLVQRAGREERLVFDFDPFPL